MKQTWIAQSKIYLMTGLVGGSVLAADTPVFYRHPAFTVYADSVERDGFRAVVDGETIQSPASFDYSTYGRAPFKPKERTESWTPDESIRELPKFHSEFPMVDVVYLMALETVQQMVDMRPEGVLNASEGRPPWVRDTAYVILDGMPAMFPSACRKSLEHTADEKRTVKPEQMYAVHLNSLKHAGLPTLQPCYAMSDFTIWIPAAMEYAMTTGDMEFLKKYYDSMCRTMDLVRQEKWDPVDGLYDGGETIGDGSLAYPENSVGQSALKGTSVNFIHYEALRSLVRAGELLGVPAEEREKYLRMASRLNDAIQREMWMDEQGIYSYMKVDRCPEVIERSSAMADAFSILFNAVGPERQAAQLAGFPDQEWGAPVVWPAWLNRTAYHDQNLWPNVEANWAVAAAQAGNPDRLTKGIAILTENAAFELGFNEMINLFQGDHRGKKPQLWAATGFLRMITEGIFGIEYCAQGMLIQPNVPSAFKGGASLDGIRWSDAEIDLQVAGSGSYIRSFRLDGKEVSNLLPKTLSGPHRVEIEMTSQPSVSLDAPLDVPAGDPVTVRSNAEFLDVMFGETAAVQRLKPTASGIFKIDWPEGALVDRIRILPIIGNDARRGRWQTVNVRPGVESEFLSGAYENARPLKVSQTVRTELRVRNNRAVPVSASIKFAAAKNGIIVPEKQTVTVPAGEEVLVPAELILPEGLPYGIYPVSADVAGVETVYNVKIAESMDLRGLWMMKGTEQENAASPELYDVTDGWEYVRIPRRWESVEKYENYDGVMWYRRTVLIPAAWADHDLEFYLQNVSGNESVWFNGVEIGKGTGAHPRSYRISSDLVRVGENNVIAVRIENPSTWPKSGLTDWPIELRVLPAQ